MALSHKKKKVIIMGAAGRDFHNFNVYFRNHEVYRVVAFTATQIPNIANRNYPPALAGRLYPKGIPIVPEDRLVALIERHEIDEVVLAYSDVSHLHVMHAASKVLAAGADFRLMGPRSTSLSSTKPVIAICAVRTGSGKSPTSQFVVAHLMRLGFRVGVVRHPMPYGDLEAMTAQCFRTYDDFSRYQATLEEREEYEPYIREGVPVWAGVDYGKILRRAAKEVDVIVWDGGNNDFPFYRPDLHITIVDPHRAGHETTFHPGETNLRAADVILIGKSGTARPEAITALKRSVRAANPNARIFRTDLRITAQSGRSVRGKRVIVIEDGPTLTHGEMSHGAGLIFAERAGAIIVDPSDYAIGSMRRIYADYPHIGKVLPAMGYGGKQLREFQATINKTPADFVIDATPVDLGRLIEVNKPLVQVKYALRASRAFKDLLRDFVGKTARR